MAPLVPILPQARSAPALRVHATTLPGVGWGQVLGSITPESVQMLKHSEQVAVIRTTLSLDGAPAEVILKTEPQRGLRQRIRTVLRATRLHRHWARALLLEATGAFPTARCLALLEWKAPDGMPCLTLVMEALGGKTLLQTMADWEQGDAPSARGRHALAREVARLTTAIMRAGLYNRDHKPSNLIVTRLDPPAVALIDLVGIRTTARPTLHAHCAALVIEPLGTGVLPPKALLMRGLATMLPDRSERHAAWRAIAQRVREHGDPRPKDNPLGP